jgi:hypothetical protein
MAAARARARAARRLRARAAEYFLLGFGAGLRTAGALFVADWALAVLGV